VTTAAEVWKTLSRVDVSEHVEKKAGLSYLSWAWAWGVLMEHYPEARYYFLENEIHPDHSVTVTCEVQIGDVKRVMWLPVMDHRNRAIENPDARQISDAKMRCLVKCLGIFGLGLSLYAGSDLPMHEPDEKPKAKPQPKAEPKPEPKPEEPAQAKEANKDNTDHIDTPEGAFAVVSHTLEIAKEFCESKAELREFYIKNRNVASVLETKFPEQHKRLMDGYQEISKQFEE
jgi:hypothetical protein